MPGEFFSVKKSRVPFEAGRLAGRSFLTFLGPERLEGIVDFGEGPFLKKCPSRSFFRFRSEGKRELQAAAGAGFRQIRPPWRSTMCLQMARPSPVEAGLLRCFSTL